MRSANPPSARAQREPPPAFWLIAAICFAVLSLLVIAVALRGFAKAADSVRWPTAEGTVLRSELRSGVESDWAEISYQYIVDGTNYQGTNLRTADIQFDNSLDEAQQTIHRYPVGARVLVHYDPADPRTAVLEPGITAGPPLLAVVAVCPVFLSWAAFHHWKRGRAASPGSRRS